MNAYERVALEYYDRRLHPTCHNLRVGSDIGFDECASEFFNCDGSILEVGIGLSTLQNDPRRGNNTIVGIDLNPGMLANSQGCLAAADATLLPFRDESFVGVYGSLIDPFNTDATHTESHRVLRPSGLYVFTVPDVRWVRHNQRTSILPPHTAGITLQDGETVLLPSIVLEHDEQIAILSSAGFGQIDVVRVPIDAIDRSELSSRFLTPDGRPVTEHIITVYKCRR